MLLGSLWWRRAVNRPVVLFQERVIQQLACSGACRVIDSKCGFDKIEEQRIFAAQVHRFKRQDGREVQLNSVPVFLLAIRILHSFKKHAVLRHVPARMSTLVKKSLRERTAHSCHTRQHSWDTLVVEHHVAGKKLRENTPKRPHVNPSVIVAPKDYLWGSIAPRLDVRGQIVRCEAAAAKVDDTHLTAAVRLDKDIFRLQVAVHQIHVVDKCQCC
mmetsp:Transcript_35952/g.42013  ORF Transcript_35952/g.42013 Transcript_35952/m.42013 type:complete len:215 (+) Transcript_35952:658-1302(+)